MRAPSPDKLLIASPAIEDPRFRQAVILVCTHNEDHAMGIVLNKAAEDLTCPNCSISLASTAMKRRTTAMCCRAVRSAGIAGSCFIRKITTATARRCPSAKASALLRRGTCFTP